MRVTSTSLCELIGRPYAWLDSRRRAARSRLAAGGMDAAQAGLPLSSFDPGALFDLRDVLRMAVAVEAERMGLSFDAGARLALEARAEQVLAYAGQADLYAVSCQAADGNRHCWCGPQPGPDMRPAGSVAVNLSDLLRRLRQRAGELGLALEPGDIRPGRQLRPQLRNAIRPPKVVA